MDAIKLRLTRFGTHPTQVNQYETANLGLSSQLGDRCDVTVTKQPGIFRIIIRYTAVMKQHVDPPDVLSVNGARFPIRVSNVSQRASRVIKSKSKAQLILAVFNREGSKSHTRGDIVHRLQRHEFDHLVISEFLDLVLHILQVFRSKMDANDFFRLSRGIESDGENSLF